MRKIAAAMIVAGISLFAVTPALAAPHNPHQEEQDGCDHGHTGKPCRPDPQPDHGKDCVKHGKHGGINEDHCASTTSTTQPPTTTTTQPEVTTTTVPEVTTTTQPEVTTTTEPPAVTTTQPPVVTGTQCVTPDGFAYTTSLSECPPAAEVPVVNQTPITALPHTGAWSLYLALLGTAAGLTGLGLMLFSRTLRRTEES
jgi:hypothetical protein